MRDAASSQVCLPCWCAAPVPTSCVYARGADVGAARSPWGYSALHCARYKPHAGGCEALGIRCPCREPGRPSGVLCTGRTNRSGTQRAPSWRASAPQGLVAISHLACISTPGLGSHLSPGRAAVSHLMPRRRELTLVDVICLSLLSMSPHTCACSFSLCSRLYICARYPVLGNSCAQQGGVRREQGGSSLSRLLRAQTCASQQVPVCMSSLKDHRAKISRTCTAQRGGPLLQARFSY
jgi:hypothetical protein